MIYYKFYRSFNYRLILYLLISIFLKELITLIASTLELLLDTDPSYFDTIMLIGNSMFWYSVWTIQLCIAFMTAEIFSMVIFSVELKKAEIPLTIACFTLPLVELIGLHLAEQLDNFFIYNAILGMVFAGTCAITIVITSIYLAYRGLRRRVIDNDNEEQHLLHAELARQRYRNALKESLPFFIYPAMILLWLLAYYVLVYTEQVIYALSVTLGILEANTGTISSIVFFIHIKILGQRRRSIFRNRSHNTAPSHSMQEIHESQRITIAGSVTATHVTRFDPLGDSDIEP